MATIIEIDDPETGVPARCSLTLDGWQSDSRAASALVSRTWQTFDYPGYLPGRPQAFARSLGARLIEVDPEFDRVPDDADA